MISRHQIEILVFLLKFNVANKTWLFFLYFYILHGDLINYEDREELLRLLTHEGNVFSQIEDFAIYFTNYWYFIYFSDILLYSETAQRGKKFDGIKCISANERIFFKYSPITLGALETSTRLLPVWKFEN